MRKHFTASGIVFHDDKVLLIKHKKMNTWIYPGGHVEAQETPDEALLREIEEETGYKAEVLAVEPFTYADDKARTLPRPFCVLEESICEEDEHKHIDFIYLCRLTDGNVHRQPEYEDQKWVGEDEIDRLDVLDNFKHVLREAFKALG